MANVICDTSALQYLHQLELVYLLEELAERVIVPESVVDEIAAGKEAGINLPVPTSIQKSLIPAIRPLLDRLHEFGFYLFSTN